MSMRLEGGYSMRRIVPWIGIASALFAVFLQCLRLYLVERIPGRAFQALVALIQITNCVLGAIFELFPSLHGANLSSEAFLKRCRQRHLVQMIIFNVMSGVMQTSYSYLPLLESVHICSPEDHMLMDASSAFELSSSQNSCIGYQVIKPKVSPIAIQTLVQTANLLIESSVHVLLTVNLCDLPLYLFLDYRYVTLNGLFEPGQAAMGLVKHALTLIALKLGLVAFLPLLLDSSKAGPRQKLLIVTVSITVLVAEIISLAYGTFMGEAKQYGTLEVLAIIFSSFILFSFGFSSSPVKVEGISSTGGEEGRNKQTKRPQTNLSQIDTFFDAIASKVLMEEEIPKTKSLSLQLDQSMSLEAALMQEVKDVAQSVEARGGEKGRKDKIELLETIGGGAHGTVFRGRWRNMEVAVKTVLFPFEQGSSSAAAKQRAILEAGVSCSVSHHNVVATYHYDIKAVHTPRSLSLSSTEVEQATSGAAPGSGSTSSGGVHADNSLSKSGNDLKLFLVQELCAASLDKMIEAGLFHSLDMSRGYVPEGGWQDLNQGQGKSVAVLLCVYGCLFDVASGMEYLHERSIIHGDLKPENILTKKETQRPHGFTCKITDFGLSAMMDPMKTHVSNFKQGTPFYVAPEVLTGQTTTASDVFSFGIFMAELYTGNQPWIYGEGRFRPNPNFLPRLEKEAPPQYTKIVRSCLKMNPKERSVFSSIRASLEDLYNQELKRQW